MTPHAPLGMTSNLDTGILEKRYFDAPNSLDKLSPLERSGLMPLGLLALLSITSVSALLIFITHRLISWRKHYKEYVGYNQYVVLIYNLLIADLQQSIAFSISFHWLRVDGILAPTTACFLQGWFLQIGDVSSGFFVLAIAIHTWLGVVKGYKLPYMWFVVSILMLWLFALVLTILGPAIYGGRYFTRTAEWVSSRFSVQDNGYFETNANSAGSLSILKMSACGSIISGSLSSNSEQSSYTLTSSSICGIVFAASWQTTPRS
jgi:hypothetical protein